jgi:hypothetical protein
VLWFAQLVDLDKLVKDTFADKDIKKKMSSVNAKVGSCVPTQATCASLSSLLFCGWQALNSMKSKLRKTLKDYEKDIEGYLKNPLAEDKEEVRWNLLVTLNFIFSP